MQILKATLKCLCRLLDLGLPLHADFFPALTSCQYDCHDKDQDEMILLALQKTSLKLLVSDTAAENKK